MKTVLQVFLWALSIFFAWSIYNSVMDPIKFDKVKRKRYSAVIEKLKDIRDAQEAHREITRSYAKNFDDLIRFIDTAQFVITQQRDSSYIEFDKTYRIDVERQVKVIDTLGYKSVKDSLFRGSDSYKNLATIPFAQNNAEFTMKTDVIEQSGFKAPVFEVTVDKSLLLYDQPADLVSREKEMISVEEVNGPEIKLGSLTEVSTSGNWPPIYDTKESK